MKLFQKPTTSKAGVSASRFPRQLRMSTVETLSVIGALVFIVIVLLFYFLQVKPLAEQASLLRNREYDLRLQLEKRNSEEVKRQDQSNNSERIIGSLTQFERGLKADELGMTQIINEIDTLGRSNKILIGDASYRLDEGDASFDEKGAPVAATSANEKKPSVYPVMAIDTTVIGDYPNLRRFLAALEKSNQFVIINSLAFQGEGDKVRRETSKVGAAAQVELGSPESVPVSLKIELDTYFQKPGNGP